MNVVSAALDTAKCGLDYAIAKLVSVTLVSAGPTFAFLPIVFMFMSALALALVVSAIIGATAGAVFGTRWSCEE